MTFGRVAAFAVTVRLRANPAGLGSARSRMPQRNDCLGWVTNPAGSGLARSRIPQRNEFLGCVPSGPYGLISNLLDVGRPKLVLAGE